MNIIKLITYRRALQANKLFTPKEWVFNKKTEIKVEVLEYSIWKNKVLYKSTIEKDKYCDKLSRFIDMFDINESIFREMKDEEKIAMYMKCKKKELISMLVECHRIMEADFRPNKNVTNTNS